MNNEILTLDPKDTAVIAARDAETSLFRHYGLQVKDHYLPIPGTNLKMRISEIGTGEPVLVVPGNTGDVFPLASLLSEMKGRRIIAINRPGGGLSEGIDHTTVNIREFAVETIIAVMDAFQLDKVNIVAHSMGAHWSLWTAMDRPERVKSLTLLGNPGNVMKGKLPLALRLMIHWPFNKLLYKLMMGKEGDKRPTMLKAMGSTSETIDKLPKEIGESYYAFRRLPHYLISFTSLLKNAAPNIDAAQLSGVKQPVQLLMGDKDTFASVPVGQSIAEAIPDCKYHIINEGSHLPWLEKSEECGKLINDFLTQYNE
ncbi:alpha/beta fold hydrolase [Pedobacter sp. L105]|uniref:alpha/beta fold hydrolase n=1 Tax=Pedobacter sp. L105 TaxID=1641871 RepID=UPI00131C1883|nr:alpha/beta hydrolase [Pedobacter sp. L105]